MDIPSGRRHHDAMRTPSFLWLARHGETDWNAAGRAHGGTDIPLNETGRGQARRLAQRLRGEPLAALVASDLLRASETARIVGEAAGLEPLLQREWREVNLGALEGETDAARAHGELISALAASPGPLGAGGETFAAFVERIDRGYRHLCEAHAGEVVAVVAHGGTLKTLIARLIGLPPEGIGRLSLRGNGGLSAVDFRHGRPQLVLLNDTSHMG